MAWSKSTRISVMLAIDTIFFLLELGVGVAVGSLALMADAFHMLNDIISLVVGLWAVKAAQKTSNAKYSFGWLRAEILGAFFNAVFLIALCLSIVLEAVTRLVDPPPIGNPRLILVVGCLGLASNLAGFFVLGGHGHAHGGGAGHDHGDHQDEVRDAEEGHSHGNTHVEEGHSHSEEGLRHNTSNQDESSRTPNKGRLGRRTSRGHGRLSSIEDLSIHPASFRQEIIAASKSSQLDGIESEGSAISDDDFDDDDLATTERTSLLSRSHRAHSRRRSASRRRREQVHANHHHTKPAKASTHHHGDMGMNAMILHVIGDALGNVGVIVSALIIMLSDWSGRYYADPAVSLFITLIILKSTIPLTSATAKILLQATPDHIDVSEIITDIQSIEDVTNCHHVHIWQLSDTQYVASMHVKVAFPIGEAGGERFMRLAKEAKRCLHDYGVHSVTIQPEYSPSTMRLDGASGPGEAADDSRCLMGCVDDCEDAGCCSASTANGSQKSPSEDGHDLVS